MAMETGRTLQHYRLVDKIGEGGMGVVWRAVDTSLDREVAIKVLPETLAADPERLARFDREAKLLASLNHPNIASIYGFHEADGVRFVAMELVEGEDLSERTARGPVPVDEALEIGAQIAEALAAAHDRGVIHRDLKPANVRIAPDGTVKVLDFGLAKSLDPDGIASGDPSASPTMTTGGTAFGVILGTAAYMSPEQARGRAVDRRADLWAFGCVLYEMLTGARAFDGETVTDTLSAVISRDPDWDLLPAATPAATRRLLRRCLAKNASDRLRDAGDARLDLAEVDRTGDRDPAAATDAPTRSPARAAAGLVLAAVAGAAAVGLAWWLSPAPSPAGPAVNLPPARQATFTGDLYYSTGFTGNPRGLDLAADGRTAVYLTRDRRRAVLIDLEGGGSQVLFTAEPGKTLYDLAWSPDGGRVHLMTWPYSERVSSVPRFGGEPRPELDLHKLAGLNGIVVRPLGDDRWLVAGDHNTLYIGDDPAALEARGTQLHGEGVFRIEGLEELGRIAIARDGRRIAFEGVDPDGRPRAGIADLTGKSAFFEAWSELQPVDWTDDDRALFLWRPTDRNVGDVLQVAIDPTSGRPTSEPELVYPRLSAWNFRVSADGARLAASDGDRVVNLREIALDGSTSPDDNRTRMRTGGTGLWQIHDILPDGTLLAALDGGLGWELFAVSDDDVRRSLVRLPSAPLGVAASHDGASIAIAIDRPSPAVLIHHVPDNRSRTIPVPEALSYLDWSRDGAHVVSMTTSSADHIVVVDVEEGTASRIELDCGDRCEFAYEGIRAGPAWPYFAATSEVDTWIVNAETGALRHVAANTWTIVAWQDDHIWFARSGGQTDWPGDVLYRVPADGGPEERLLDLPPDCAGFELDASSRFLVCAADESRLDLQIVDGL